MSTITLFVVIALWLDAVRKEIASSFPSSLHPSFLPACFVFITIADYRYHHHMDSSSNAQLCEPHVLRLLFIPQLMSLLFPQVTVRGE